MEYIRQIRLTVFDDDEVIAASDLVYCFPPFDGQCRSGGILSATGRLKGQKHSRYFTMTSKLTEPCIAHAVSVLAVHSNPLKASQALPVPDHRRRS